MLLCPIEDRTFQDRYFEIVWRLWKQKAPGVPQFTFEKQKLTLSTLQNLLDLVFATKTNKTLNECVFAHLLNSNTPIQNSEFSKVVSNIHVMNFAQLVLYKTLPCPQEDKCPYSPRQLAPSNQYQDSELACYYYHHDKDQRRVPIPFKFKDDFTYTANYNKFNDADNTGKYSQNYFESMFHPMYYKLFKCKRNNCERSCFCPFIHSDLEKIIWDEIFKEFIFKSRDVLTKRKELETRNNYYSKPKDFNPIQLQSEKTKVQAKYLSYNTRSLDVSPQLQVEHSNSVSSSIYPTSTFRMYSSYSKGSYSETPMQYMENVPSNTSLEFDLEEREIDEVDQDLSQETKSFAERLNKIMFTLSQTQALIAQTKEEPSIAQIETKNMFKKEDRALNSFFNVSVVNNINEIRLSKNN